MMIVPAGVKVLLALGLSIPLFCAIWCATWRRLPKAATARSNAFN